MATVKYTGPIASFHCPTDAEIRHLKVHFSPKQEGTGDPSPENVRPIVGWDGVELTHTGKNLFDINNITNVNTDAWCSSSEYIIKPSNGDKTLYIPCLSNTTYTISKTIGDVLAGGYTISTPESGVNLYSYHRDKNARNITISTGSDAKYIAIWYYDKSKTTDKNITPEDVIKTLQIEYNSTPTSYESCSKENVSYQFGTLGKNKFDKSTVSTYKRINMSGEIVAQSGMSISDYIPVYPNLQYTITTAAGIEGNKRHAYYDENKSFLRILPEDPTTITIPEDARYIRLTLYDSALDTTQLELGSTATAYEPYNPNKTVYGGWVDLITGEVQEEYGIMHLDETNNWTGYANAGAKTRVYLDSGANAIASAAYAIVPSVSNKFVSQGQNGYPNENKFCFSNTTEGRMFLGLSSSITSLEDFKTWFGNLGGADFAYELITPITYQLHSTELQTFLGQNNVWSNADYVEVEYDLHETQTILQRKQYILANQPHIVTAQDKLVNFRTDLAAPLKSCKVNFEPKQDLHGYDSVWIGGNGKNLFNPNLTQQNPSNTTTNPSTARIFTEGTYCIGTSWSNYYVPTNVYMYEVTSDHITVQNGNVYGVGVVCKLTPNETYSLSATTTNGRATVIFYDIDGTYISGIANGILGSNFIVPSNADITVINFYGPDNGDAATFTNIQLELGSTATSYAPYENICPIEGWNGFEVYKAGKNLCSAATTNEMINNWVYASSGYNQYIIGLPLDKNFTLQTNVLEDKGENISNCRLYFNGLHTSGNFINTSNGSGVKILTDKPASNGTIFLSHNMRGLSPQYLNTQLKDTQLEYGSIATEFEPYQGITIPIDWSDSAGTIYGGYIDLISGQLVATHALCTIDGTEGGYSYKSWWGGMIAVPKSPVLTSAIYCSILPCVSTLSGLDSERKNKCYAVKRNETSTEIGFGLVDMFDSAESFKEYAANLYANGTPIQICGPLETPIYYTLTPTQLKSLKGVNNIWSDANGNVEVSYWSH